MDIEEIGQCGPEKGSKGVRAFLGGFGLGWFKWLRNLCGTHDDGYDTSSGVAREKADGVFRSFYKKTTNPIKKIIARIYFLAVRKFGKRYYKGNKEKKD